MPSHASGVALTGTAAQAWLSAHGWHARPDRPLRLFADVIRADPFALGRIWHTAATMSLAGNEHWGDEHFLAVLGVEGDQMLSTPRGVVPLAPGSFHIQRLNEELVVSAPRACARIVIVSDWASIGVPAPPAPPSVIDQDYVKVFVSAVNAALNLPNLPPGDAFTHLKLGIESLFAATVTVADAPPPHESIFERAESLIRQRSLDPRFDVRRLIQELGTSRASLYRAFEAHGRAPSTDIRARRVAAARAMMQRTTPRSQDDLLRVAFSSGFGSVKSMQRALTSEPEPAAPTEAETTRPVLIT
ncbi:hypothetical protein [Microbacterium sp. SLBN-111]|uniref:hypothetical protein n=1 Tax=Microbacterium sp. SLBN-111 TaxID=3377733 RepID=UPI003C73726B